MFARHFVVVIEFFYIDYNTNFLKTLLFQNKKALQQKAKGLEIDELPLLERFGTFKEDIGIENIRLNHLILQY